SRVLETNFGNHSSTQGLRRSSIALIKGARKKIAKLFKVKAQEIIFTSGGTEADNLVLTSPVRDLGVKRIISSEIEHHAVLHTIDELAEKFKIQVEYVYLTENGIVDYNHLEELIKNST